MRMRTCIVLLLCSLAGAGCSRQKSTDELVHDMMSSGERDRIIAVRLLPQHRKDAAKVVPVLIEALKDRADDVRWSAAIGLGYFGAQARDAIPALQTAEHDRDARVREAARVALGRIDPTLAPRNAPGKTRG